MDIGIEEDYKEKEMAQEDKKIEEEKGEEDEEEEENEDQEEEEDDEEEEKTFKCICKKDIEIGKIRIHLSKKLSGDKKTKRFIWKLMTKTISRKCKRIIIKTIINLKLLKKIKKLKKVYNEKKMGIKIKRKY